MEEVVQEQSLESVETFIAEQAVKTENAEPSTEQVETKPEKTFTQDEVNEMMKRRVERAEASASKKAAQEARDAYIAEQNYEWQGKTIKTEAEYKQALQEKALMEQYQNRGLDDDIVKELVESKRFREEYQTKQQQQQAEEKERADFQAFIKAFPDAKAEDIPPTVWADVQNGSSLVDAYTRHENQSLKQKLAAIEQQKQIEQQNEANAQSSTGSVTGNGSAVPTFFTKKQVDGMSQSEVNKHWDAINQSMKNPKFYD
ncbi:hypothetical protein [Cohnella sp. GCM10027633]|uniref:hypothetical protein n=1 Tax=unclassified Cohnella TaxID=2636738 RepID=UPI00362BD7D0